MGPPGAAIAADDADRALRAIAAADDAPSLSTYLDHEATLDQILEFMVHRSAYQLKEADPHSWAIPRLYGRPKAALVEVQADEYGGGRPERAHAQLFAQSMRAVGLDAAYGAYLEAIPGVTLATVNLMSMFGLHRRLLGASVGHLALFEMTSSIPNRHYGDALRRHEFNGDATEFYDEDVEADAVHENIAAVDLAGGLIRQQPALAPDVAFGARALIELDGHWARRLLGCWQRGKSSLRSGGPTAAAALARPDSRSLGARKSTSLCVPSQNGRMRDLPQRHNATVSRPATISRPCWSWIRKFPRISLIAIDPPLS